MTREVAKILVNSSLLPVISIFFFLYEDEVKAILLWISDKFFLYDLV